MLIDFTTKPCLHCGKSSTLRINAEQLALWNKGILVQTAFPDMPAPERELLISGTHPECWNKIFDPAKEEEEEE